MGTLYLCGAGNSEGVRLALRVNASARRWSRVVLLDDDPETWGGSLLGVEVVGAFDELGDADPSCDATVNLVARTTAGRRRAGERIDGFGVPRTGLVAPGVDTLGADLAADVLVYPGAIVGPEVRIGAGSVVFMGAVVGHESRVGPGCVVAANAVLNARVELGAGVYVGSNATILPEIAVGAGATVGAGSTVVEAVAAGETVLGVPARPLASPPARGPQPSIDGFGTDPAASSRDDLPTRGTRVETVTAVLATAWAEVLGRSSVAPDAPVFELGATSLAALRVAERLRRETGLPVAVVDLFRYPTVAGLARHLAGSEPEAPVSPAPPTPELVGPVPSGPASASAGSGSGTATSGAPGPEAEAEAGGGAGTARVWSGGDEASVVRAVATIFGEVLGERVGPDAHFFDLGGDPGRAQEACRALHDLTGEPVCFMQIARYPTPRVLARHLLQSRGQPPTCPAQGVMNRLIHRHERHRN